MTNFFSKDKPFHLIGLFSSLFLFVTIPLTVYSFLTYQDYSSQAATNNVIPNSIFSGTVSQNGVWTGWLFNNPGLLGQPVLTINANKINNKWGNSNPFSGVISRNYSVQWKGNFDFKGGPYRFNLTANDGVKVFLDQNPLIDHWTESSLRTYNLSVNIVAGTHSLEVDYFNKNGPSTIMFNWVSPSCYDLTGDSQVNRDDLVIFDKHLYSKGDSLPWDFNSDGVVNAQDLELFAQSYNTSCSSS